MRLDDLTWLVGSWQTIAPSSPNDCPVPVTEILSDLCFLRAHEGVMAGAWHFGVGSIVLIAIRDTEDGLEWRQRAFSPGLEPDPNAPMLILELVSSAHELIFESRGETGHPRQTVVRIGLRRTGSSGLAIRFLVPDSAEGWSVVRDDHHVRSPPGAA